MKKLSIISVLLLSLMLTGVAMAAQVTPIPSVGFKAVGDITSQYGKVGWDDNGNRYRLVYNGGDSPLYAGEPAYFLYSADNAYTVARYGTTGSYEAFAGISHCNLDGADVITMEAYGWLQDNGYCLAWVSGESTNVFEGTVLQGSLINNNGRGGRSLKVDRPLTAGSQWGSSEAQVRALFNYAGTSVVTRSAVMLKVK